MSYPRENNIYLIICVGILGQLSEAVRKKEIIRKLVVANVCIDRKTTQTVTITPYRLFCSSIVGTGFGFEVEHEC
jgi:hypothetical protein